MTIVALACACLPSISLADGDPASDVLATQTLFLPQDAAAAPRQAAELSGLLSAAAQSGFQARVALIASQSDLGSITALWREPRSYAEYLGQELSLIYHGPLIVVMPNGYSVYRLSGQRPAEQSALAGLGAPGNALASGAIAAVQRLAAVNGHSLSLPNASPSSSPGATNAVAWLVFAVGAAFIVLAWVLSLRARPLRLGAGARRGAQ